MVEALARTKRTGLLSRYGLYLTVSISSQRVE